MNTRDLAGQPGPSVCKRTPNRRIIGRFLLPLFEMERVNLQRFIALTVLPAALLVLLAVPAIAESPAVEIGGPNGLPTPSCTGTAANDRGKPKGLGRCSVLTMTTVYPIRDGSSENPTTVPKNGRIVAITMRIGKLADSRTCLKKGMVKGHYVCTSWDYFKEKSYFDKTFGSGSRVRLVVLRPAAKKRGQVMPKTLVAMGNEIRLEPLFGKKVTLPLTTTIPVKKGDVVGLSVPTYAPILPLAPSGTADAWRSSRPPIGFKPKDPTTGLPIKIDPVTKKPADPCSTKFGVIFTQSALTTGSVTADFRCHYPGVPTFEFTVIPSVY